jgi:hypothetical protein
MLIKKPQVNIVSRRIRLYTGEEALAYFAIIAIEGAREVRFLGIRPIEQAEMPAEAEALLLENRPAKVFGETPIRTIYERTNPFYTLDFLTSQSARAPSAR